MQMMQPDIILGNYHKKTKMKNLLVTVSESQFGFKLRMADLFGYLSPIEGIWLGFFVTLYAFE